MFPFKTNRRKINTKLNDEEVENCLKRHIIKDRLFELTSNLNFVGHLESNFAKIELGQFPFKNAFRPIIILNWKNNEINSYLRLDYRIIFTCLMPLFVGIYLSIEEKMVTPIIVTLFLSILLLVIVYILFSYSKIQTLKQLDLIFKEF